MNYIRSIKKIFQFTGKIIMVFVVILAIIGVFSNAILGSGKGGASIVEENEKIRDQYYQLVFDTETGKTPLGRTSQKIAQYIFCATLGETCTADKNDIPKHVQNSAVGYIVKTITLPYTSPPASAIAYVQHTLADAGFIPQAQAAEGVGFAALRPFIGIWKIFRNLTYLFLVLVLVVIGFLIMFRVKINPQTVIGIENSIPRIIAGMLVITFSFAIAGFFIDLMYVFTSLIISIMSQNGILDYTAAEYQQKVFSSGHGFLFWEVVFNADNLAIVDGLLKIFPSYITFLVRILGMFIIYLILSKYSLTRDIFTGEIVRDIFTLGGIPSFLLKIVLWWKVIIPAASLTPLLIALLIFFSAFFIFLKIVFLVVRIYVELLMLTIFAPIIILFSVIPGKNTVSYWIKSLLGNLLAFPVIVAMMMLSAIIIKTPMSGELWRPPFMEGLEDTRSITLLLGTIILFLTPNAVKTVKGLVGAKGLAESGIGLGTLFLGATSALGGGMGILSQFASFKMATHYIPSFGKKIDKTALAERAAEEEKKRMIDEYLLHEAQKFHGRT